ncbi:hypothetical protein C5167_020565 [Papaver somniferum]|uniref:Uncharacterized protein n=1 Tax=Papaver somniferum TaxID=3469 RepID=A0A4Y7IVG3_PAPSO|nr:hypothetical protein C5167_020565 [Papaver somniferum]
MQIGSGGFVTEGCRLAHEHQLVVVVAVNEIEIMRGRWLEVIEIAVLLMVVVLLSLGMSYNGNWCAVAEKKLKRKDDLSKELKNRVSCRFEKCFELYCRGFDAI